MNSRWWIHFIAKKNIEKDIISVGPFSTIHQDKRILLRGLEFAFLFLLFFFGTVTSEHTCLRLHCDWSMILAFGHLRDQEIYIFTRMPLYRVSAWSWRTIPLIDLSTNKVYPHVSSWAECLYCLFPLVIYIALTVSILWRSTAQFPTPLNGV